MKQHISPQQLNELTEDQKEKLREWWKPNYSIGDIFVKKEFLNSSCPNAHVNTYESAKYCMKCGASLKEPEYEQVIDVITKCDCGGEYCNGTNFDAAEYNFEDWAPLLSIGQMVEFLDDHSSDFWTIRKKTLIEDGTYDEDNRYFRIKGIGKKEIGGELVDALWEAVKYILQKE